MVYLNKFTMHDNDNVERCPFCGSMLLNIDESKVPKFQMPSDGRFVVSSKENCRVMTKNEGDEKFHQLVEALKDFKLSR